MGSKKGKKLKFSVESILEPTADATTSRSCPEPILNIYQASISSVATQAVSSSLKLNSNTTELQHAQLTNNSDSLVTDSGTADCFKSKKGRMRFTQEQIQALEKRFQEQHYLIPADRKILAFALRMSERQVKTWFQNRRAQYKRSKPLVRSPQLHHMKPTYRFPMDPLLSANSATLSYWHYAIQRLACTPGSPTSMPTVQARSN